jgi:hypothetical protein
MLFLGTVGFVLHISVLVLVGILMQVIPAFFIPFLRMISGWPGAVVAIITPDQADFIIPVLGILFRGVIVVIVVAIGRVTPIVIPSPIISRIIIVAPIVWSRVAHIVEASAVTPASVA